MKTPVKKLKECPHVPPQNENGTPTKAKRARKCILSNTLKNTELAMKNFGLGWSREIQEQQLLVKTLVLSISYCQLIILTSLDGFLCLFLKPDILMDHYIHLKLSTSFCVGCYST